MTHMGESRMDAFNQDVLATNGREKIGTQVMALAEIRVA